MLFFYQSTSNTAKCLQTTYKARALQMTSTRRRQLIIIIKKNIKKRVFLDLKKHMNFTPTAKFKAMQKSENVHKIRSINHKRFTHNTTDDSQRWDAKNKFPAELWGL